MRTGFHHFARLQNTLLTGWSWSRSGSNLVTRWWHLSKSAIFFGNQWTRKRAERRISAVLVLLLCILMSGALTFDFLGGFYILWVPLQGADEGADVWQVQFAADEELQALRVVFELPAWSCLQMMNLCFKGLTKSLKQLKPPACQVIK